MPTSYATHQLLRTGKSWCPAADSHLHSVFHKFGDIIAPVSVTCNANGSRDGDGTGECITTVVTFASKAIFKQIKDTAETMFGHVDNIPKLDAMAQADHILNALPWEMVSPEPPIATSRSIGRHNRYHHYL